MAGYTGHIPTVQKEEFVNQIVHTKHIPGYMGFVSAIKSENKHGESYGKETAQSLADRCSFICKIYFNCKRRL